MRVLAAYGPDDIPKMSREHTFVKSIFLLQMLQYDDQDAPEDTIIHDLKISNVRPHHTIYLPPPFSISSLIPDPSSCTQYLHIP
jgi:hypothetical protein